MTAEQMNDMSTDQEEKEVGRHLEAIYWGGVIIWAGLIFGALSFPFWFLRLHPFSNMFQ